jgi:hypothetical protein
MSRIQSLVSSPKRTLAALATVLVAVGITTASGANFNAQSANAANTFATGTLSIDNSLPGAAILTATNLRPGASAPDGTVTIKNDGTLDGVFTLSKDTLEDNDIAHPMSGKLNLTVLDCGSAAADGDPDPVCASGDDVVYTGTIANMGTRPLGTFDPEERHIYKFSVQLDASANDDYQGDNSSVRFVWDAATS